MRFKPFAALRPHPEAVARVASPPYDVVTREEAARLAGGNPLSFLHVVRSDIDLPAETDPYDDPVYQMARANLERLVRDGILVREAAPAVYLYELVMEGRAQVGVVGCVHVNDYAAEVIRKHEKTRPDKENDRTRHILELNAQAEPVILTFRDRPELEQLIAEGITGPPLYDFTASDGVHHRIWSVSDPAPFVGAFEAVPVAYVADGHHRCAAAWRAARERRGDPAPGAPAEADWFLAVLFPAGRLRILPYHRVVRDLGGLSAGSFLDRLREVGRLVPAHTPEPPRPGSFGFHLEGRWHLLVLDPEQIPREDPVGSLDAALLEDRVLRPILGISDVRTDPRVDFVGGIRGTAELERRVASGAAALAIALHPVTVEQLLAVADAGGIMPPKTTWFEPKLSSGLFVHTL